MLQSLPRLPALHSSLLAHLRPCCCWAPRQQQKYTQHACFKPSSHADTAQHADQLLSDLCSQYGIQSAVSVARGTSGLGLYLRTHDTTANTASQQPTAGVLSSTRTPDALNAATAAPEAQEEKAEPAAATTPAQSCSTTQQHQATGPLLQQYEKQQHQQLLVSVPLHLILSCSIPGCSPQPQHTPTALHHLLFHTSCSAAWELQLAALLLWALRQPPTSSVGSFWRRYAALIPPLQDQGSLLLWSEQELGQLQDVLLQQTAVAWKQQVHAAYYTAVQPCFSAMAAAAAGDSSMVASSSSSSSSSSSVSSSGRSSIDKQGAGVSGSSSSQACTLEEWLWAVAAVESRAFGVDKVLLPAWSTRNSKGNLDTSSNSTSNSVAELVGLVPVLDLANHTCRPDCHHGLNQTTGTFDLFCSSSSNSNSSCSSSNSSRSSSSSNSSGNSSACSSGSCDSGNGQLPAVTSDVITSSQHGKEVLITYGQKDNRHLMEQYGFCVANNPFNRVQFPQWQQQQLWLSHKAVKSAAHQVKQQLALQHRHDQQQQQQQQQQQLPQVLQPDGFAALAAADNCVDAAVASIINAAGWKSLRQYKQVTPGSTVQCAQQLLEAVQTQMQSCPTTLADDCALLQQLILQQHPGDPSGLAKSRLVAAVQYRLGQKQLVDATGRILQCIIEADRSLA